MNLGVIGTGYVGLVTAVCLAEVGHQVYAMDNDLLKIEQLQNGELPIYEPGLKELLVQNLVRKRLSFTTDLKSTVQHSEVIFIAVGTPEITFDTPQTIVSNSKKPGSSSEIPDGTTDGKTGGLQNIFGVTQQISEHMDTDKVIVIKSTVPVGTGQKIEALIRDELEKRQVNFNFTVVTNPEFLKEGSAVEDFLKPDRIIIGTDDKPAQEILKKVYEGFFRLNERLIFMDRISAEFTKYAANAMLATRISFMNELAQLCEKTGADITKIRNAIGADHRIGPHFLYPGVGYGGSCLPKDVRALIRTGEEHGLEMPILRGVDHVNIAQRNWFFAKIKNEMKELRGKVFAVWGLAFKPGTDDVREAPALDLIKFLISEGALVQAYDPVASINAERALRDVAHVSFKSDSGDALIGADALILMTEWREFRNPDFALIKKTLRSPIIFDGRNQYSVTEMSKQGLRYIPIGRRHS